MTKYFILGLIFFIGINHAASSFSCFFVNNSTDAVELVCDDLSGDSVKDNCSSILFGEESREIDQLKVKSMKIGACHHHIEQDWKTFLGSFQNLEDFDISFANVDNKDFGSIWKLRRMKKLNATHNRLSYLPFIGDEIYEIDYSYNHIQGDNRRLESLRNSKMIGMINLSHNVISSIPDNTFKDLKELLSLDLSYNRIAAVSPYLFNDCPKLKILLLQNNRIGKLALEKRVSRFLLEILF